MSESKNKPVSNKSIEGWLNEFSNPSTRRMYKNRIQNFFAATGLSEEKLREMEPDDIKSAIMNYRREALAKGEKQNSVLAVIIAVRSYLAQINKSVKFRRGMLGKVEADNESHVFTNGDLKQLFQVGDTQEKAIIATASSLGWEISSFLELERERVYRLIEHAKANDEKFIFFEDTRSKTSEARLAVFNPLAIEWLSKYLETRKDDNPKLFPFTPDGIQKMLSRLAVNSGLKTTGGLRFHNIRKWLMSRLSRCGFNEFQIKFILGKAIGVSDRTYLQTLKVEIEEKYPTVYNDYLNIDFQAASGISKEQVKKLSELEKKYNNLEYAFNSLLTAFKERGLLAKDYSLEEIIHDQEERDKQAEDILKEE